MYFCFLNLIQIERELIMSINVNDLPEVKAANNVNWAKATMPVTEMDSDFHQEDLMCAIMQENAISRETLMQDEDYSEQEWQDILDGNNDKYEVVFSEENLTDLAHDAVNYYEERYNDLLDTFKDSLTKNQRKMFDALHESALYTKYNFGLTLDDDAINDDVVIVYSQNKDGSYTWYELSENHA